MKKRIITLLCTGIIGGMLSGCGDTEVTGQVQNTAEQMSTDWNQIRVEPTDKIEKLEEGLSVVRYEGEDGFTAFLEQGGAESDSEVAEYLTQTLSGNGLKILFGGNAFGCSTLSVAGEDTGYYFGRNFDWDTCEALIVASKPAQGYASVSTVNKDFIQSGGIDLSKFPDNVQAAVALYAPLDGMNEEGLTVSVNMIQDSDSIDQNTEKTDITTTTAVRLLLNHAATVDEAIKLLDQYDLHASMGMMIHFAIADADGNSVAVEYVDNEMQVISTDVVTNFYLTEGKKYGKGTEQSKERYKILKHTLEEKKKMSGTDVRDALDSVSKDNFNDEYASTEWSIVMNQNTKELTYFHRENYGTGYTIVVQ